MDAFVQTAKCYSLCGNKPVNVCMGKLSAPAQIVRKKETSQIFKQNKNTSEC
jgi:hypothetical protein